MKKVLVYSHNPFSEKYNNGKTFKNIFSYFSKNELSQLYITSYHKPDFSICDQYFCVSDQDALKSILPFQKTNIGGVVHEKNGVENNKKAEKGRVNKQILKYIRNIIWRLSRWHTPELEAWIKEQKPDVLFFPAGDYVFSHRNALFLSQYYNIPLITFFGDDYVINPQYNNLFARAYNRKLLYINRKIINRSIKLYAIGDLMAKDYSVFFNKKFDTLMNCVDEKLFIPPCNSEKVIISFFGGLHLNRWKSLIIFAETLSQQNLNKEYSINIYTFTNLADNIKKRLNELHVYFKAPTTGKDLDQAIENSHILLHLESFDAEMRRLIKYSVSTKIPEYLISSRLVVACGPSDVASVKLLNDNMIGLILDIENESFKENMNLFVSFIENVQLANPIVENGYNFALQRFTKKVVAKSLHETINDL